MTDLELALRTPGRVLLLDRRQYAALLERSIGNAHAGHGGGLLGGLLGRLGIGRVRASDDADERPTTLALPQVQWAGTVEHGEGYLIVDGVAVIDVSGVLTPDGYYDWWSERWIGGYAQIGAAYDAAQDDDRVQAVFVRYDTPGGLVDGCFDLATAMRSRNAANGGKPYWAHARMACSAGYALACGADRVLANAEGEVGSIGVVIVHTEVSAWLAENGIKVTAVESGPRKTDGAPWKPLGEDVQTYWQAIVDQVARKFAATVEAGRGLSLDQIAALEARWFMAEHDDPQISGIALGLADEAASERAAFASLVDFLSDTTGAGAPGGAGSSVKRATTTKETEMSLAEQVAALRAKAARGDKSAKAELKKLGVAPVAQTEDDEDTAETEDDEDTAETEDDDDTAETEDKEEGKKSKSKSKSSKAEDDEDDDDDTEAEDDDDDEPEAKATGSKVAFRLLGAKEAKGREDLARRLAEKVSARKLTYGEAKGMLAAAPRKSRLGDAMAGRDRNPGRDAPNAGKAGAGLSAAVDRLNAKRAAR